MIQKVCTLYLIRTYFKNPLKLNLSKVAKIQSKVVPCIKIQVGICKLHSQCHKKSQKHTSASLLSLTISLSLSSHIVKQKSIF